MAIYYKPSPEPEEAESTAGCRTPWLVPLFSGSEKTNLCNKTACLSSQNPGQAEAGWTVVMTWYSQTNELNLWVFCKQQLVAETILCKISLFVSSAEMYLFIYLSVCREREKREEPEEQNIRSFWF